MYASHTTIRHSLYSYFWNGRLKSEKKHRIYRMINGQRQQTAAIVPNQEEPPPKRNNNNTKQTLWRSHLHAMIGLILFRALYLTHTYSLSPHILRSTLLYLWCTSICWYAKTDKRRTGKYMHDHKKKHQRNWLKEIKKTVSQSTIMDFYLVTISRTLILRTLSRVLRSWNSFHE